GTVGADEPVTIAVGELDRDLLEERLGTELDGDVGGRKHVNPLNRNTAEWAAVALVGGTRMGLRRHASPPFRQTESNRAGALSLRISTCGPPAGHLAWD